MVTLISWTNYLHPEYLNDYLNVIFRNICKTTFTYLRP